MHGRELAGKPDSSIELDRDDGAGNFKPKLYKNVYNDSATDWKVWHFVGALPLTENDEHGKPLVFTDWLVLGQDAAMDWSVA